MIYYYDYYNYVWYSYCCCYYYCYCCYYTIITAIYYYQYYYHYSHLHPMFRQTHMMCKAGIWRWNSQVPRLRHHAENSHASVITLITSVGKTRFHKLCVRQSGTNEWDPINLCLLAYPRCFGYSPRGFPSKMGRETSWNHETLFLTCGHQRIKIQLGPTSVLWRGSRLDTWLIYRLRDILWFSLKLTSLGRSCESWAFQFETSKKACKSLEWSCLPWATILPHPSPNPQLFPPHWCSLIEAAVSHILPCRGIR